MERMAETKKAKDKLQRLESKALDDKKLTLAEIKKRSETDIQDN